MGNIITILRVWGPGDCDLGAGLVFLMAGEVGNQKVFLIFFTQVFGFFVGLRFHTAIIL